MWKFLIISIVAVILVLFFLGKNEQNNRQKRQVYWSSPSIEQLSIISPILSTNNISGCGEYRVCDMGNGEIKVACSSDGIMWTYYDVWINIGKVNLTPSEEIKSFSKPN